MSEQLVLTVNYKGEELEFPLMLTKRGYTYGIEINIDGWAVMLEPDEEGALRVIAMDAGKVKRKEPDQELLKAVVLSIQELR